MSGYSVYNIYGICSRMGEEMAICLEWPFSFLSKEQANFVCKALNNCLPSFQMTAPKLIRFEVR